MTQGEANSARCAPNCAPNFRPTWAAASARTQDGSLGLVDASWGDSSALAGILREQSIRVEPSLGTSAQEKHRRDDPHDPHKLMRAWQPAVCREKCSRILRSSSSHRLPALSRALASNPQTSRDPSPEFAGRPRSSLLSPLSGSPGLPAALNSWPRIGARRSPLSLSQVCLSARRQPLAPLQVAARPETAGGPKSAPPAIGSTQRARRRGRESHMRDTYSMRLHSGPKFLREFLRLLFSPYRSVPRVRASACRQMVTSKK